MNIHRILGTAIAALALLPVGAAGQRLLIYTENNPLAQYVDSSGNLTGAAVEIVQEIQRRVGNTDEIHLVPWARGLAELDSKPNVMLFNTARTAVRNDKYQWVGPILEGGGGFFTRSTTNTVITGINDAKQLASIGVVNADTRDQELSRMGFHNLDKAKDVESMIKKLMAGRNDAIAASVTAVESQIKQAGYSFADIKLQYVFMRVQSWLAFSKETSPALIKRWQDALDAMKQDGTFQKIYFKYYPNLPLPGKPITSFE